MPGPDKGEGLPLRPGPGLGRPLRAGDPPATPPERESADGFSVTG